MVFSHGAARLLRVAGYHGTELDDASIVTRMMVAAHHGKPEWDDLEESPTAREDAMEAFTRNRGKELLKMRTQPAVGGGAGLFGHGMEVQCPRCLKTGPCGYWRCSNERCKTEFFVDRESTMDVQRTWNPDVQNYLVEGMKQDDRVCDAWTYLERVRFLEMSAAEPVVEAICTDGVRFALMKSLVGRLAHAMSIGLRVSIPTRRSHDCPQH